MLFLSEDIPAFHCSFCNKCCLTDLVLDGSEPSKRSVLGLNHGFTHCGTANNIANVNLFGSFVWVCSTCKTTPKNRTHSSTDSQELTNCPPLWLSKFLEDIVDKLNNLDEKVNTNINVLAADLAAMRGNVSEQLSRFEGLQLEASTGNETKSNDVSSPERKRKAP